MRPNVGFIKDADSYDIPAYFQNGDDNLSPIKSECYRSSASTCVKNRIKGTGTLTTIDESVVFLDGILTAGTIPTTIKGLRMPAVISLLLDALISKVGDEAALVVVFLFVLTRTNRGEQLSRQAKRVISKAHKKLMINESLVESIKGLTVAELGGWILADRQIM